MKGADLPNSLLSALHAWGLSPSSLQGSVDSGLINSTYKVMQGQTPRILQRLHPVFSPQIHVNIRAVSEALRAKGIQSPQLVPHQGGQDTFTDAHARTWRMLEYVEGRTLTTLTSPEQAHAAAAFLASWHAALQDLPHTFVGRRSGVHDTDAHRNTLQQALNRHQTHRLFGPVNALATALEDILCNLTPLPDLELTVAHGDPKISNLRFATDSPTPIAWIDLDTVGPMRFAHELGDALRSWCASAHEDGPTSNVDLKLHQAAIEGYLSAYPRSPPVLPQLRAGLLWGPCWISAELATRFAADALNESYFGFDATRYSAAGEHNLARAQSQLALAQSFRATLEKRRQQLQRGGL